THGHQAVPAARAPVEASALAGGARLMTVAVLPRSGTAAARRRPRPARGERGEFAPPPSAAPEFTHARSAAPAAEFVTRASAAASASEFGTP
ncbi:MAG TPA: hypothetical protein VFS37_04485, partial [Conexibacter sp.]|nr:hypothetical protein [Conexibacter sp.]